MLCLWELHIALKYTCLWWVRSVVFFVSALGNISVYALVIFITLSVLMIFSYLTFLDTKQSRVQLVLKIQRVLGVQIRKSFVTIRDWRERYSKKPRCFSNEVSSNNVKSPFPGQLAESFRLRIYKSILNRSVLQMCKIGYFPMIEGPLPMLALSIQSWSSKKGLVVF